MTRQLVVLRRATADVDAQSEHLGRDDRVVAERFLAAANVTFADLLATPGLGRVREFEAARLSGLRSWRIRGFENWLVFYRVTDEAVEIVRVLHGARDLAAAFEDEQTPGEM